MKQSTVSEREKPSVWLHRQQPAGRGGRQICTGSLNTSTAGVAKQSELNKYQSGRRNLVNGKLKTETLKVPPPSLLKLADRHGGRVSSLSTAKPRTNDANVRPAVALKR